ncbi:MAG: GAF domain-containing protein [Armatimonadetes bacterium]|nr:GAF domain-containing protein [Armatimonadota bacterium]
MLRERPGESGETNPVLQVRESDPVLLPGRATTNDRLSPSALSKPPPQGDLEKTVAAALAEPIDEMLPEHEALLTETLVQAVEALPANRGFLALVDLRTGELAVRFTLGEGWDQAKRTARVPISEQVGRGITTQVATTGKPYRCGNVLTDPYYIEFFSDVRSELAVPLIDRSGCTIGVLNVESPEYESFNEQDERHLMALANRAALALSLAHYQAREKALIEIGKGMSSETDLRELTSKITKVTTEILPAEDCSIFLWNRESGKLVLADSYGPLSSHIGDPDASYDLGYGLTGWVGLHRQSIRIVDPAKDPRWKGLYVELPPKELGAFLAVPICGHEELLGVLRAVRRHRSSQAFIPDEFTDADEDIMWTLASQIAISIENAHLMDRVIVSERMAALGEMSARTAHMMGNAIFGIKGQINEFEFLVADDLADKATTQELVEKIKRGIFRVEEMLQEFRDFVRSDQIRPVRVDLNSVVEQAARETLPADSKVVLSLSLLRELPLVKADPSKLHSAFAELIENAVAEQPNGGRCHVRTSLAEPRDLNEVYGRPLEKPHLKIEFLDEGPGVQRENKIKIFDPFYSTKAKGMGLGLSIVQGIIQAHKGTIKELGDEGCGARFVILLPVNGESAPRKNMSISPKQTDCPLHTLLEGET